MGNPLYDICCFSLGAFNIFSLCLIFVSLINLCLDVFLFESESEKSFSHVRLFATSWTDYTVHGIL